MISVIVCWLVLALAPSSPPPTHTHTSPLHIAILEARMMSEALCVAVTRAHSLFRISEKLRVGGVLLILHHRRRHLSPAARRMRGKEEEEELQEEG